MRRTLILLAISVFAAIPLAAQNTDIESLSGLQFNFGNPGARSLGMGGAFLGLADDASAAEANPAGLTILRKPEISIEGRNYLEQQVLTTSGTYPNLERTAFTHYSNRAAITFGSFVYPFKNFAIAGYYHEPLRNEGSGQVIPIRNQFSGRIEKQVPSFYLNRDTQNPLTTQGCQDLRRSTGDFFSCVQYTVLPFLTAVDIRQRTWGVAGAWKIGKLSIGAAARYQELSESAFTYRVDDAFNFSSISVQATGKLDNGEIKPKSEKDITGSVGFKWEPTERFSIGGVYKQGPKFKAPTFIATVETGLEFVQGDETTFHIPDIYGLGVSFRPIPVLTLNADAVRVKYSNLVDNFFSINGDIRAIDHAYRAADVTELHAGAEYFFSTKIPFAVRAGYWRDPAHSVEFNGPVNGAAAVGAAILFPKGQDQNHYSVGGGLAWPRFQIDAAYDTSEHYKVGSISVVTRF